MMTDISLAMIDTLSELLSKEEVKCDGIVRSFYFVLFVVYFTFSYGVMTVVDASETSSNIAAVVANESDDMTDSTTNDATNFTAAYVASLDKVLSEIFNTVKSSVAQIEVTEVESNPQLFVNDTQAQSIKSRFGSGFVYDADGTIVTNYHVINYPGRELQSITVRFLSGESYEGVIIGSDKFSDLAILSLNDSESEIFTPLILANSSKVQVGQQVIAIGSPEGLTGSMSTGIVSQVNRTIEDEAEHRYFQTGLIQTDATIAHGSSGGPLLNLAGQVIGVNFRQQPTAQGNETLQGLSFAIPSNTVKRVTSSLLQNGTFDHAWLGIHVQDVTPDISDALELQTNSGVLITDITQDSPASKAGLTGGTNPIDLTLGQINSDADLILRVDDRIIKTSSDLVGYIESKCPSDVVNIFVSRSDDADGKSARKISTIPITLEKRPMDIQNFDGNSCT